MRRIFILLIILQISNLNAQDDAFTNEVHNINGLLYFHDKPFTGTLFSAEDNISNNCECTLKAKYSGGKLNGLKEEWYTSGQKKSKGNFTQGKKNGTHIVWNTKGRNFIKKPDIFILVF